VARVVNMGPLVSLLTAGEVRQKFLRVNRDLVQNFTVLGTGEQLVVSHSVHALGWAGKEFDMCQYNHDHIITYSPAA
jgi:hypothetical protein